MNCVGDKVKVLPDTKTVILPKEHEGKIYNIDNDTFIEKDDPENYELMDDDYEEDFEEENNFIVMDEYHMLKGGSKKKSKSKNSQIEIDNFEDETPDDLDEEKRIEEYKRFKELDDQLTDSDDDYEEMESLLKTMRSKSSKKNSQKYNNETTDEEDNEDNEEEFEEFDFEEDEIEVVDVIEKNVILEKAEKDKFYNENLQISELNKIFINQYPFLLRNNDMIINTVFKKVNNFMNIKNNIVAHKLDELSENEIKNFKPLLIKYGLGNLRNHFLYPLVVHKKKIYVDDKSKYDADSYDKDFVNVENFYSEINGINYLQEYKKYNKNKNVKQVYDPIKFNIEIQKILEPMDANMTNNDVKNKYNMFKTKLGKTNREFNKIKLFDIKNIDNTKSNYLKNYNILGKIIHLNQVEYQDVMTVNYCFNPVKCQVFNSSGEKVIFNTNLAPPLKFIPLKDISDDTMPIMPKNQITNNISNYKFIDNSDNGEDVNIIGFVRLPLNKIYNITKRECNLLKNTTESQTYLDALDKTTLKIVEINDNNDNDPLFFKFENKTVIYLFTKDTKKEDTSFIDLVDKILPTFDDIIQFHKPVLSKSKNHNLIFDLLDIHYFKKEYLSYNQYKQIYKIQETIFKNLNSKNEELLDTFSKISKLNKRTSHSSNKNNFNISNNFIAELEKISGRKYIEKDYELDEDYLRYKWVTNINNGVSFLNTSILLDFYDKINIEASLNEYETNLETIKKHLNILKTTSKEKTISQDNKCSSFGLNNVKIVRYKSISELEKDNGVEIRDSNDNIINIGDIAIIDDNDSKKSPSIYKRMLINNTEMWVIEGKQYLKTILEEEKNKINNLKLSKDNYDIETNLCNSIYSQYFNFNLDEPNCTFDLDNELFKCMSIDKSITLTKIRQKEEDIEMTEQEIENMQKLKTEKKLLEKQIKEIKNQIMAKNKKTTEIEKELIEIRKEEDKLLQKQAKIKKPCIHYEMINYISKIKNTTLDEQYRLYQIVFNNYLNTDYIYNLEEVSENYDHDHNDNHNHSHQLVSNNHNHTMCNICNQHLLCKHWYYGIKKLETTGTININDMVNIYGVESNGVVVCKICGEVLVSTDIQDLVEMGRGEQGKVLVNRQVMENKDQEKNKKIQLIDEYLKQLEMEEKYDTDLYFRMEFYYHIKQLLNIKMTQEDEREMILFIRTHEFIKKEALYAQLRLKRADLPMKVVHTLVLTKFNKFVCADLAARFLIIIQTSIKEYQIKNNFCNSNYMGFPLINNIKEDDGINLLNCIFKQFALRNKYKFLEKGMDKILMDRLIYFVENDEFVKNKISNALHNKTIEITNKLDFTLYENNLWPDFLPHMNIHVDWQPDKKLLKKELELVKGSNFKKMLDVCHQNLFYNTYQIAFLINKAVNNEMVLNKFFKTTTITNSCCLEQLPANNYYNYFTSKNKEIITIENEKNRMFENYLYLKDIEDDLIRKIETPLYDNITLKLLPIEYHISDDEINKYFLRFIDEGPFRGKQHIFDNYGVCTLSNILKTTIENTRYSQHEFNKLRYIVYQNTLNKYEVGDDDKIIKEEDIKEKKVVDFKLKENGFTLLDYIINNTMSNRKLSILRNVLTNIRKNIEEDKLDNNIIEWGTIISQTNTDIKMLIKGLTNKKKDIDELTKNLENLGNYDKLIDQEIKRGFSSKESNIFKYKKKETEIKKNYEFLLKSVLQVKNEKIRYEKKIENIRIQYQYLYPFKEDTNLFERIYKIVNNYKLLFKTLYGQSNSFITSENISIILHYLLIHSLLMILYDREDNIHKSNKSFKKSSKKSSIKDFDKSIRQIKEHHKDEEGGFIDETDFNDLQNNKKTGKMFYQKINFLMLYIKHITKRQEYFDNLTETFIEDKRSNFEQKQQRRNLKLFQILKTEEGMEEFHNMILSKLHYGMLEYSSLEGVMDDLGFNTDTNYDNNMAEKDDVDDKEIYKNKKEDDDILDTNFNDGNVVYASDDEGVEDTDFINIAYDD